MLSRQILCIFFQFKNTCATFKCMCGCTCNEVSTLCILINTEDPQAEITAHRHFLFQQEKLSEGGS